MMECRATFHLCAPFLGLKRLQAAVNEHLGGTAELKPEGLQVDICRHLAKENAELLENLYKTTITYFYSSWEEIRAVVAKLAGIILERTDTQHMKWLDLEQLLILDEFLVESGSPHSLEHGRRVPVEEPKALFVLERFCSVVFRALQVLQKDPSPTVQLVATPVLSDICPGRMLGE
ncbi:unnamed protein product, partial [Lepidochelys kempii]